MYTVRHSVSAVPVSACYLRQVGLISDTCWADQSWDGQGQASQKIAPMVIALFPTLNNLTLSVKQVFADVTCQMFKEVRCWTTDTTKTTYKCTNRKLVQPCVRRYHILTTALGGTNRDIAACHRTCFRKLWGLGGCVPGGKTSFTETEKCVEGCPPTENNQFSCATHGMVW